MTSHLHALCFDAHDPLRLADFWAAFLCWERSEDPSAGITLLPSDDTGFRLRFLPAREPKAGRNHMHFDLTSTSLDNQKQAVDRALELGARHIDVGQRPEEGHVVLADPDGHEFCVLKSGRPAEECATHAGLAAISSR
ncbi:VOC family protein [Streptomyces sp. NPDC002742]|uniref:VOC family protein n=1 Tax=Streptomyces sp. NPDC002742 TaxID=3364663 RepID=UPI0036A76D4D